MTAQVAATWMVERLANAAYQGESDAKVVADGRVLGTQFGRVVGG
ncbi:hypothetical protein [Rhodopirellula halodulae]|nr:hypothetical protein [Rhodopirellula sp. JC737]